MGYMNADELEDIEGRDAQQYTRTSSKADAINAQLTAQV
jgi:hypothetical protein